MKARLVKLVLAVAAAATVAAGLGGNAQAAGRATRAAAPPTLQVQSCIGDSFCLAVGSEAGHARVAVNEEWNGKAWRVIPNPKGFSGSITCGGLNFCLAAVPTPKAPRFKEVEWNGRAWVRFKPQPPASNVGCLSPKFCVELIEDDQLPDAEVYWTGGSTWSPMPGTDSGCGGAWCDITSFGCSSATNCQDSGNYCGDSDCDDGTFDYSDTWNGTTWNDTTNNGPPGGGYQACGGRSFCLAFSPPHLASASNDWGANWHDASAGLAAACSHAANCGTYPVQLVCDSSRSCLALNGPDPTGAVVWNGTKWTFVKLALIGGHLPKITALACGGPGNCMASGTYQLNPRGAAKPVIEHWNGNSWTVTAIATP